MATLSRATQARLQRTLGMSMEDIVTGGDDEGGNEYEESESERYEASESRSVSRYEESESENARSPTKRNSNSARPSVDSTTKTEADDGSHSGDESPSQRRRSLSDQAQYHDSYAFSPAPPLHTGNGDSDSQREDKGDESEGSMSLDKEESSDARSDSVIVVEGETEEDQNATPATTTTPAKKGRGGGLIAVMLRKLKQKALKLDETVLKQEEMISELEEEHHALNDELEAARKNITAEVLATAKVQAGESQLRRRKRMLAKGRDPDAVADATGWTDTESEGSSDDEAGTASEEEEEDGNVSDGMIPAEFLDRTPHRHSIDVIREVLSTNIDLQKKLRNIGQDMRKMLDRKKIQEEVIDELHIENQQISEEIRLCKTGIPDLEALHAELEVTKNRNRVLKAMNDGALQDAMMDLERTFVESQATMIHQDAEMAELELEKQALLRRLEGLQGETHGLLQNAEIDHHTGLQQARGSDVSLKARSRAFSGTSQSLLQAEVERRHVDAVQASSLTMTEEVLQQGRQVTPLTANGEASVTADTSRTTDHKACPEQTPPSQTDPESSPKPSTHADTQTDTRTRHPLAHVAQEESHKAPQTNEIDPRTANAVPQAVDVVPQPQEVSQKVSQEVSQGVSQATVGGPYTADEVPQSMDQSATQSNTNMATQKPQAPGTAPQSIDEVSQPQKLSQEVSHTTTDGPHTADEAAQSMNQSATQSTTHKPQTPDTAPQSIDEAPQPQKLSQEVSQKVSHTTADGPHTADQVPQSTEQAVAQSSTHRASAGEVKVQVVAKKKKKTSAFSDLKNFWSRR